MESQPKVFVIILNYNGEQTILKCLSSVYQSTYTPFEVVLVDNNSQDNSFELAKENFSRTHFIKNSTNLGFSAGNNIGIRFALEKFADFVLLLNNDAYLEKDTLHNLIKQANNQTKPAILNPLILNADGESVWFSGGTLDWSRARTLHQTQALQATQNTDYNTGCAMLIPKEIFKKIGLFDERYFLYYEDADFSQRAKLAGFVLKVCPEAKAIHAEQSALNKTTKIYWLVLSGMLFFQTHSNFLQKIYFFCYFGLRNLKNQFQLIGQRNPQAIQVQRAYQDFRKIKAS